MRRSAILAVLAVVAAVTLMTGCSGGSAGSGGSGGSGGSASSGGSGGSSASPQKPPVVFAAMGPGSGAEAIPGPQSVKSQYQALAAAWNAQGGINGHPVKLVFYDTKSSAAVAAKLARQIKNSGAKALFTCCSPAETLAADAVTKRAGPVTFNVDPNVAMPAGSYLFDAAPPASAGIQAIEKFLALKKWTNVALLTDTTQGAASVRSAFQAGQKTYGYHIVSSQMFDVTAASVAAQVAKFASVKPDAVVVFSVGPQISTVFGDLNTSRLAGTPVILADGDLSLPLLRSTSSSIPQDTYVPGAYYLVAPPTGIPARPAAVLKAFLHATGRSGDSNDNSASYIVDSFGVAVDALQHLGVDASSQQILNYLQHLDYRGVNGAYHFTPGNHMGLAGGHLGIVQVAPGTVQLTPVTNAGVTAQKTPAGGAS